MEESEDGGTGLLFRLSCAVIIVLFKSISCADESSVRFSDIFRHLMHMDIRRNAEHRNTPIQRIYKAFHHVARPFFRHAGISRQHLDRLQDRNTLIDLRLVMR